jgi:hypothetical protein
MRIKYQETRDVSRVLRLVKIDLLWDGFVKNRPVLGLKS